LNEVVWHYKTSSGSPKKWLHRNHDTIFRYANGPIDGITWNHPKEPWPEKTLKKWQKDEEGRIYRAQHKYGKRYYIDPEGKLMDDVWEMTLSSRSRERLGYPTQKPEALLERIIVASSNEGDIILDPFCGSGTTLSVADRLGRRWLGIDSNPRAIEISRGRLANQQQAVPIAA
jgi:site-specific DNA-methyltransferase (adenine-specific)